MLILFPECEHRPEFVSLQRLTYPGIWTNIPGSDRWCFRLYPVPKGHAGLESRQCEVDPTAPYWFSPAVSVEPPSEPDLHVSAHILFLDFDDGGTVLPGIGFQHTIAHYIVGFAQYADLLRNTIEIVQATNCGIILADDFNIHTAEQLVSVHGPPEVAAPVFVPFHVHYPKFVQFVFPLLIGNVEEYLSVLRALQRTVFVPLGRFFPDDTNVIAQVTDSLAGVRDLCLFLGQREMQFFCQELTQVLFD